MPDAAGSPSTARDRAIETAVTSAVLREVAGFRRSIEVDALAALMETLPIVVENAVRLVPAGGSAPAEAAVRRVVETIDFADSSYDYVCADVDTDVIRLAILNRKDIDVTTSVLRDEIRAFVATLAGGTAPADEPEPEDGNAFFQTAWAEHGRCTCLPGDDIYCEEERCALCTALPTAWPCPTTEHRGYPGANDATPAGGSAPHQGATTAPSHAELVRAIADPGSFLPRGDNYSEPITSWSARAVRALLGAGETTEETHG